MTSAELAMATIRNMQKDFVGWDGYDITSLEIDPYGLRAKAVWTETSTQAHKAPTYNSTWVGTDLVQTYGQTTQYTTSQNQREDIQIVPFPEVVDLIVAFHPTLNRNYKWALEIYLEGDRSVVLHLPNEYSARKLGDAIYTLAVAQGRQINPGRLGVMFADLNATQFLAMGLPAGEGGVLVTMVAQGGLADLAGIKRLDVLYKVEGKTYSDVKGYCDAVKNGPSPLTAVVLRRVPGLDERKRAGETIAEKTITISDKNPAPSSKGGG